MKYLFIILILCSCVTREEINAVVWLNNFNCKKNEENCKKEILDPNNMEFLCGRYPEIKNRGFYRQLNNGKKEFISICNENARNTVTATAKDFNEIIDRALPKPKKSRD